MISKSISLEHSISQLQTTSFDNPSCESSELFMKENEELSEKINKLESKLRECRMFATLEKDNRRIEKKKLQETSNNLKLRILQLE